MPVKTQSYLDSSFINCDSQDLSSREGQRWGGEGEALLRLPDGRGALLRPFTILFCNNQERNFNCYVSDVKLNISSNQEISSFVLSLVCIFT